MKNIVKFIIIIFSILIVSCNKDDEPSPKPIDTRLPLPAVLENVNIQAIPDATPAGTAGSNATPGIIESRITIDKDGIIANTSKISIELDLSHDWCGDIVVELFAPSGASCGLIKRLGAPTDTAAGNGYNFILGNKLVFNSTNSVPISITSDIASGNYAPTSGSSNFPTSVPMLSLNTFLLNQNIKGLWKIIVYDYGNGDTGSLNSWKLSFDAGALQ